MPGVAGEGYQTVAAIGLLRIRKQMRVGHGPPATTRDAVES